MRITLAGVLCSLLAALALILGISERAAAADAVGFGTSREPTAVESPVDIYGRQMFDALGPIEYLDGPEATIVRSAYGRWTTLPLVGAPAQPPASTGSAQIGYSLGGYVARAIGSHPGSVAIGDVTGDGRPDVVVTTTSFDDPVRDNQVFVYPQQPDGTLGEPLMYPFLVSTNFTGLVLVDLDEDGVRDVVVGHRVGITVLLADGHGGLKPGTVVSDAEAIVLGTTDVDLDGHADIVSLGWQRGATIFHGDGHGGFRGVVPLVTKVGGYNDLDIGDLSGDGIDDLAVMSGQGDTPSVNVHRHDGRTGYPSPADAYYLGGYQVGHNIGLGDVTGEGRNDILLSRLWNVPTWLWVMAQDASGHLAAPFTIPTYEIPETIEVTDLDGDGREDVAVLHGGWLRVGIYLQQPGGGLGAESLYPIPYSTHYPPQGLAVGDFTSDGCPDVAITDAGHGLVTLTGMGCVGPTPILLSLIGVDVTPERVRLTWLSADHNVDHATLYRRSNTSGWEACGHAAADEEGRLVFEDSDFGGEVRWCYRVGLARAGQEIFLGETWVDVPRGARFALAGVRSNPARDGLEVAFSLPDAVPARLEMFDVTGRRIEAREVGDLGGGNHVVKLGEARQMASGVYVLRLTRQSRVLTSHGVLIH